MKDEERKKEINCEGCALLFLETILSMFSNGISFTLSGNILPSLPLCFEALYSSSIFRYTCSYTYLGVANIGLGSPYKRLLVPDFLMDMQPLVLSKDNVPI